MNSTIAATAVASMLLLATTAEGAKYFILQAPGIATSADALSFFKNACGDSSVTPFTADKNTHSEWVITNHADITCKNTLPPSITPIEDNLDSCYSDNTFTLGLNGRYCPVAIGATCKADQYCATWTGTREGSLCPASKSCAYPKPTHALWSQAEFPSHYLDYDTPAPVTNFLIQTLSENCALASFAPAFGGFVAKKGRVVTQGWSIRDVTRCKVDDLVVKLQTIIDKWNAENPNKLYPPKNGSYIIKPITDAQQKCISTTQSLWGCKADDTGCDMTCKEGAPCTSNKQCGQYCAMSDKGIKVCQSNAFTALVAPVLAAVLVLAFF